MGKQSLLNAAEVEKAVDGAAPNPKTFTPAAEPPPATGTDLAKAEPKISAIVFSSDRPAPLEFGDAQRLARALLISRMAPESWTAKCQSSEEALAAVSLCLCFGREQGLSLTETIGSVYIVRQRPTLWGDIIGAKVLASGLMEDCGEVWKGEGETRSVKVWAKRKGIESIREVHFGYAEAKRGGLLGKDTYKAWPDDMFSRRAWARLYYRLFPDVLKGMKVAEMEMDGEAADRAAGAEAVGTTIDALPEGDAR